MKWLRAAALLVVLAGCGLRAANGASQFITLSVKAPCSINGTTTYEMVLSYPSARIIVITDAVTHRPLPGSGDLYDSPGTFQLTYPDTVTEVRVQRLGAPTDAVQHRAGAECFPTTQATTTTSTTTTSTTSTIPATTTTQTTVRPPAPPPPAATTPHRTSLPPTGAMLAGLLIAALLLLFFGFVAWVNRRPMGE